jgi:hypothetical protein
VLRCAALRCAALRCDAMRCAALRCDAHSYHFLHALPHRSLPLRPRRNRDINAPINIVKNFRCLYETGELPVAFRRETKRADLDFLPYTQRKYRWLADQNKFEWRI